MHDMSDVLISLSSFGAAEVIRHGQAWFARLAGEAGADGVEVRGELLAGDPRELEAIAAASGPLHRVYSSPEGLWSDGGALDHEALARGIDAAAQLSAARLKMSIGGFRDASAASLRALRGQLEAASVELVIENDQTFAAGTVPALERFFAAAADQGLALGMTFDIGNWHWQGECPLEAAQTFGAHVRYVHCKGVQRERHRWVAVPLSDSAAPWRAVLRALPAGMPWAIEYPLASDDLLAFTREHVTRLRQLREELR
jgi:sugar phosphate isomerase/epimerase